MNRKNKIFLFIGCILVILVLQRLYAVDNEQTVIDDRNSNNISIDNPKNPKTAGNWNLDSVILIDDDATGVDAHNWTWAVAQEWCSGNGSEGNPFLLENITITVDDASAGLTITNSNSTTYFKLSNITITNGGNGDGLELNSVSNGYVVSSNFNSNNNSGIYMNNVNDTTIELVYCVNNTIDGIYAVDSNLNTFTVDCSGNGRYGLILASCSNNTITLGDFLDNVGAGVVIVEIAEHSNSTDNEIYGNTFENNTINGVDNSTLANQWDNGVSLGNDWDDYEGVDADDDEIGDTPYDISGSAEAQDNYPYCDDGAEPVAVAVSGNGDGDRDLWEPVDVITLAILIGIFFGVFVGILVISKYLRKIF